LVATSNVNDDIKHSAYRRLQILLLKEDQKRIFSFKQMFIILKIMKKQMYYPTGISAFCQNAGQ